MHHDAPLIDSVPSRGGPVAAGSKDVGAGLAGEIIPVVQASQQRVSTDVDDEFIAVRLHARVVGGEEVADGDSSFFVSSTAVNPTLTIIANALRVADHIAGRLGVRGREQAIPVAA